GRGVVTTRSRSRRPVWITPHPTLPLKGGGFEACEGLKIGRGGGPAGPERPLFEPPERHQGQGKAGRRSEETDLERLGERAPFSDRGRRPHRPYRCPQLCREEGTKQPHENRPGEAADEIEGRGRRADLSPLHRVLQRDRRHGWHGTEAKS